MSNPLLPAKPTVPKATAPTLSAAKDEPSGLTPPLLLGVTESLKAGVLIIGRAGAIVHANRYAQHICQQLLPQSGRSLVLPTPIWRLVQALVESHELFPGYDLILEDEIPTEAGTMLQISARWLESEPEAPPNVLVTLATCYQNWPLACQQTWA
ncbi:hypothetical protein [Trichothermofontia sp.]